MNPKDIQGAFARFDAENARDPHLEQVGSEQVPKELAYSRRMSARLDAFAPDAPDAVKLAVRAQHIRRWEIPRDAYPMDRAGYLTWRTRLKQRHAEIATGILEELGYDEATRAHVEKLLLKRGLKTDPDVQLLEDTACLVFLEHYWDEFATKHDDDKLVDIVRKTWSKMSESAHAAALQLDLDERSQRIVGRALAED